MNHSNVINDCSVKYILICCNNLINAFQPPVSKGRGKQRTIAPAPVPLQSAVPGASTLTQNNSYLAQLLTTGKLADLVLWFH